MTLMAAAETLIELGAKPAGDGRIHCNTHHYAPLGSFTPKIWHVRPADESNAMLVNIDPNSANVEAVHDVRFRQRNVGMDAAAHSICSFYLSWSVLSKA